ncbi:LysE family transporter [Salmonella enterica]|nr:LysE family transporter [Salmonella enterica]
MILKTCLKIVDVSILLLITPGPTNTLLLFSGYSCGVRYSIKMILSEWSGYILAISVWGGITSFLVQEGSLFLTIIKLLSATYVAFLTVKVWRFSLKDKPEKIDVKTVFITTLLNPKSFVLAIYILPTGTFQTPQDYMVSMISVLMALLPVSFMWVIFGSSISQKGTQTFSPHSAIFCQVASLVMAIFAASMFYNSLSVLL